jgi:hypothetical protein
MAFFLKTSVMINFLHKLLLFGVKKTPFFANFFGENIFKIIISAPGVPNGLLGSIYLYATELTR